MAWLERTFLKEFIEIYKNLPELWQVKSEVYHNRILKKRSYGKLVEKLRTVEPNATIDVVKRKINILRSSYRRELRKVRRSERSGADDVYVSSLWYFDELHFLKKQESQKGGDSTHELEEQKDLNEPTTIKKKKHRSDNTDELLELATKRLKRCDDYSQMLANVWAGEFRLASEEQKFFAKKAIDDILYEARLGTLHRDSVKINEAIVNDYAEFNALDSKHETYQSSSPRSNNGSITIEHIGIEPLENDEF